MYSFLGLPFSITGDSGSDKKRRGKREGKKAGERGRVLIKVARWNFQLLSLGTGRRVPGTSISRSTLQKAHTAPWKIIECLHRDGPSLHGDDTGEALSGRRWRVILGDKPSRIVKFVD